MAPPSKRRKTSQAQEISFDPEARQEYLTGFRKRKQQRIKHAQEQAAKKEREEKIAERKQLREQRRRDLDKHVEIVDEMLRKANGSDGDDLQEETEQEKASGEAQNAEGFQGKEEGDPGHEDEYFEEDRHTTVTVEPINLSGGTDDDEEASGDDRDVKGRGNEGQENASANDSVAKKRVWTKERPEKDKPKKKKKKFRYESKLERKAVRLHQKAKNSKAAESRRASARR